MKAKKAAPAIAPTTPILMPIPTPSSSALPSGILSISRIVVATPVPSTPQIVAHTSEFLNVARRRVNLFSLDIELSGTTAIASTLCHKVGFPDRHFKRASENACRRESPGRSPLPNEKPEQSQAHQNDERDAKGPI